MSFIGVFVALFGFFLSGIRFMGFFFLIWWVFSLGFFLNKKNLGIEDLNLCRTYWFLCCSD